VRILPRYPSAPRCVAHSPGRLRRRAAPRWNRPDESYNCVPMSNVPKCSDTGAPAHSAPPGSWLEWVGCEMCREAEFESVYRYPMYLARLGEFSA